MGEAPERVSDAETTADATAVDDGAGEGADDNETADGATDGRADERAAERTDETATGEPPGSRDEKPAEPADEERDEVNSESRLVEEVRTRRWTAWLAGAAALAGLGVAYGSPSLSAVAVVPLAYVVYGALAAPPDPQVTVERRVADDRATPGDPVAVETTVRVEETVGDLRVLDGVPEELAVTEGSPRDGTPVRGGDSVTLRYTITARRGSYEFDPVRVRVRSVAGSTATALDVAADGDRVVTCAPPGATVPVTRAAPQQVGTAAADSGGEGLEFYATREYRRGDSVSRIDWRGYAKRGELTTTTYREERRAQAVVLLDVRRPTRRSPSPGAPTGAGLAAYTAETAVAHLRAAGHEVSLAVAGVAPDAVDVTVPTAGDAVWLPEAGGVGRAGRVSGTVARRTRAVLGAAAAAGRRRESEAVAAGGVGEPGESDHRTAADVAAAVPDDAHVVLVSPFADAAPLAYAHRLAVAGNAVTVLSPDATGDGTLGGRAARVDRRVRLDRVERFCEAVVDWPADRSLALAVARTVGPGSKAGRGGDRRVE